MSLLTDTDLRKILCKEKEWADKNTLHIFPFEEDSLTPVGYDVRVGKLYASSVSARMSTLADGETITIRPGDTILIETLEDIGMPMNRTISAFITSKVSKVSRGLSHISTNIDADWKGNLLIAMHNPSRNTISVGFGEALCTLNFIENKTPSTKDCGKEPGRSDILLKQFAETAKAVQKKAGNRRALLIAAKAAIIFAFGGTGYYFFKNGPGFIAMVGIGVGIANFFPWPETWQRSG